jgi:EpsD family peptidyl-prolyl cis-trans isomerase
MKHSMPVRRLVMIAFTSLLAACSKPHSGDSAATQVAAKVNKGEITVYRLNAALAQIPDLSANSTKDVSANVLQRLIDQELLVEKAQEAKLDRNPQVVQAMEAAKLSVLASAYLQQVTANVPKPSDQEIHEYYVKHPEYFSARRFYVYRSFAVKATPAEVQGIQLQLTAGKDVDAVASYLRTNKLSFVINIFSKTTEQLSAQAMARFAGLKDGDATTIPYPGGVELVQLISSTAEPVDEAQGRPFIEKFLLEQRRSDRAATEIKYLRSAATIQYLGDFKPPPVATSSPASSVDAVANGIAAGIR